MPISITGEESVQRTPLISFEPVQPHSEKFISSQAAKLHVTLGENSPGIDNLVGRFSSGNVEDYKQLLADRDRLQQINTQNDILQSVMQADPKAITPEVVSVVQGLSVSELQQPDLSSIIEKKYSELYTDTATASLQNGILEEAVEKNPEESMELLSRTQVAAYKSNYANTALDTLKKAGEDRSFLGKAWDFTERIIPFVEWYQKNDLVGGDFVTSVLPGNNLIEQYSYLWGLSNPEEFKVEFDRAIESLSESNLDVAVSWVEGFFSYGSNDANLDNLFALSDAATVIPAKTLAGALKGVVRGSTRNPTVLKAIATDLGKNSDAAAGQIIDDLKGGSLLGNIPRAKELEASIPSIASPDKLLSGAENVPQATYLRMKQSLLERADLIRRFIAEPNQVDRLLPEELVKYKDTLLREYTEKNPSTAKNVIDVEIDDAADLGNVYTAKISFGNRDGTLFKSEKAARLYFNRWIGGSGDFSVEQVGEGFKVVVRKAVDETKIDEIKLGTSQQTPESVFATFGGLVRSPDYLVSAQNVEARSVVTTSTERLNALIEEIAQPFRSVPKKEFEELQDMMVTNRQKIQYYENYGQFSDAFFDRYKKLPTEAQSDAYFAYVQMNDLDLVVRDLDWYKQKARLGLEEIEINLTDVVPPKAPFIAEDAAAAAQVEYPVATRTSTSFEGKVVDRLPLGSKDYFSVSVLKDGKATKPKPSRLISDKDLAAWKKLQDEGYKIVQVADQSLKIGDGYAGFLIVKDMKRSRLGVKNVDRKAGGHKIYQYPYYIKQGQFSEYQGTKLYRGDSTFWNFRSEKEANEFLTVLEEARQKLLRYDPDAVKFIRDNLPVGADEILADVAQKKLDLSVPFAVTRKGFRTLDTGAYANLNATDLTRNEHNLSSQVTGRYAGERSEADLSVIRSEGNLRFEIAGAPLLSPMEALKTSVGDMISVRAMNDYVLQTNQNFWREFGSILDTTEAEFRASGTAFLENPRFKVGAPEYKQLQAKNVSRAYRQLLNRPTKVDRALEAFKEKLISSVMPKFGPRGQQWLEKRMLNRSTSPGQYMRSVAFDFKLGMFNIQQLFVQANSAVNIASIAGTDGLRALTSYPMIRSALATNNPKIIEGIGEALSKTGLMSKDEFVEGVSLYKRSGFNDIGGDMAYLDDVSTPEMRKGKLRSGVSTVLKWGRTPFNEGERAMRAAGFIAAYLERKKAVKGALSRRDEAAILLRAKNLSGNMTRESNAAWQKGYAAVFTQFFGYQARIMEQMLGKKLTGAEKARLFLGYSAAYGFPVAGGAVAGFLPVRDIVQETLLGMGVDPDDTALEPFMDGFVSSMYEYVLGDEVSFAGRYGPGGIPTFWDLWRGDKNVSEVFLGASGGIISQTLLDAVPAVKAMASEFLDFEGGYHNLTADDFILPLRNISTVDNIYKLYNVWNFGVWASRNETNITEMDLPDAVMAAMTGLQPAEIEDAFAKQRVVKGFKEYIKSKQAEYVREFRQIMKTEDGKTRDYMLHQIKARMVLDGFSLKEMAQTWERAASSEMLTDVFFENYEKLPVRRAKKEAN